jgi:outer membrane protein assembly factor BamD (BamD/ComL family)
MHAAHALAAAGLAASLLLPCSAAQVTPDGLLASAKGAFDRQEYVSARQLARRVVRQHPTAPQVVDAWLVLIDSLAKLENHPRAAQECERLLAAHPQTRHRSAILRREFEIGKALAHSHARLLFFRFSRREEGAEVLEKVIAHAPFGPLADDSILAIAEAHLAARDFAVARDQYDRLLKHYPDSDLAIAARVRRAVCNMHLSAGAAYDPEPAEEARKDLELLSRVSGDAEIAARARAVRDVMAQGDYEAGLYYLRQGNLEGGVRYLEAVVAKYPDSEYAARARRLLATARDAQAKEKP